ncbi:exodeoxyribonuclease 1 [Physcia stellaris]|nr:exodeoxyribonuclease 1 [Physcia stellaris]
MLLHFGVTPYLVFDGDYLPSKAATETERAKRRDESRKAGLELYKVGRTSQAQKELQKAVDVTPEMAGQLIRELKKLGVQYVVAPYEADAQLAYLEKKGIIQGVLSEDSDLLVFGVRCLLTKLDQYGDCIEINRKDFTACRDISLVGWSDAEFRIMAILSGCDYLPSITNMGLLTAYRMVRKHKTIEKILRMLQFDGKYHVPLGYLESFQNAVLTFRHQRVFCPLSKKMTMVTNPATEHEMETLEFIGAPVDAEVAAKVAWGELHPMTKKPLRIIVPEPLRTPLRSIPTPNGMKFTDLKENKSIETFFKAKRTPLAELDPNSFTPSPRQQRLQQRAGGTWMSSPAPQGPAVSPSRRPEHSFPPIVASSTTYSQHQPSLSAPQQPTKRRRLCSDGDIEFQVSSPLPNGEVGQSRFFAPKPDQSYLGKSIAKKTKTKNSSINIWSDDSIEDAMAELPDVINCSNKILPEMSVSKDSKERLQESKAKDKGPGKAPEIFHARSSTQHNSQGSASSEPTTHSEASQATSATTVEISSQTPIQSAEKHVTAELVALKGSFGHTPELRSIVSRQNAANLKFKPGECQALRQSVKPQLIRKGSLTPLQRLGASALNRSKSFSGPIGKGEVKPNPGPLKPNSMEDTPKSVLSNEEGSLGISKRQEESMRARLPLDKGSEDLIIPDSEEEASGYSSTSEAGAIETRNLDLGRFAYQG